jgi:phage-related protein
MALRLVGLYYTEFSPSMTSGQPYELVYRSRLPDLGWVNDPTKDLALPWPRYDIGVPGWYRQGLVEVRANRQLIETLMAGQDTAIILGAAIFNQGNSPQRPFGWEGLEHIQVWIGQHLNWPLARWPWAYNYWNAWFEQYSVGIGQITPAEAKRLGFIPSQTDLFDPSTNIHVMQKKLTDTYTRALALGLSRSDALVLMMVSNNNEFDTIDNFRQFHQDIKQFLRYSPYAQRQLSRMMTYVHHLNVQEGWPLPADVEWDYLCQLARTTWHRTQ